MPRTTLGAESAGFFGKLPSRGDFVGRSLPDSFLQPWDNWLQHALAASREQLGKTWPDAYCVSPIWRFALSAGLCGPGAYSGILMPSVDRVNRYYPLLIAAPLATDAALLTLTTSAWFASAEQLALSALEQDDLDLDAFTQQVHALGMPASHNNDYSKPAASKAWHCQLPDNLPIPHIALALADHLLLHGFTQPSLWWSDGSQQVARSLLVCDGMPPTKGFVGLLVGAWERWGWEQKLLITMDEPFAAEGA